MAEPLFSPSGRGVDERFREIELAAVAEILRETLQEPFEPARALPSLKAPMTRLIRRIARRQIVPGRAGAEHPQHAVQHRARVGPRPSATIGSPRGRKLRFEDRPLGVSQVPAGEYDDDRNSVHNPASGFMR